MPAAVDHPATREQVRLLYIANGGNLTLAAKTVGVPVDRAEKWKERSKISWDSPNDPAAKQMAVSDSVGNTADNLAKQLAEDGLQTRIGFSKAARKVAESLPNRSGDDLLERDTAQAAKHWAGVASIAQPGWEQERKTDGGLVSVALIRLELSSNVRTEQAPNDPADRAKPVHAIETGE